MTSAALGTAVALVAVIAVSDLLLSLALARRIRHLQEHRRSGRNIDWELIGKVILPFEATSLDGRRVTNAMFEQSSYVIAFVAVGCDACVRLKREILASPPPEPFIVIASGRGNDEMPDFVIELAEVAAETIWTEDLRVPHEAFWIRAYPTVVRVVNGVIVAAGLTFDDVRSIPLAA